MSESLAEQGPEAFCEAREVNIPDLNIWRWQAERIAYSLIDEEHTSYDLAHSVSRFFDDVKFIGIELKPEEMQADEEPLYEWFMRISRGDDHEPPDTSNLINYCLGNLNVTKLDGDVIGENKGVRILDLDLFRKQLDEVDILQRTPGRGYHYRDEHRSEIIKTTLLEVLELTHYGIIRTSQNKVIQSKLSLTLNLTDFNLSQQ